MVTAALRSWFRVAGSWSQDARALRTPGSALPEAEVDRLRSFFTTHAMLSPAPQRSVAELVKGLVAKLDGR